MLKKLFGAGDNPSSRKDFEYLYKLIRELLPPETKGADLTPGSNLQELGFDSMKYINLMFRIEDMLNIDIEDIVSEIDIEQLQTINDIHLLIHSIRNKEAK